MGFDALAFESAELGGARAGRDGAGSELFLVHGGGYGQAAVVVGPGPGLAFEPGGGQGVRERRGVCSDSA